MKKSTLFFKVMVLLALLVPWTGTWGQDDVSTQSLGGSWHDNSKTKGTLTLTIDGSGNIVDGEYKSSNYGGIRAEESVSNGVLSFDLQDWKFAEYKNSPVIVSSRGWDAKDCFFINLNKPNQGGHATVKISKGKNTLSDFYKYFMIKVTKNYNEGNIKVVFKKGQTDISNNLTFSYAEKKGSKPYDGKNISVDEAKDGLTILNNGSKWNGEYTITVEEGKDVGKYDITVTIETSEYTAKTTFTDAYEITPKELTVTIKDQEITLPTESLDTELTSTGADATIGIEGIVNNENVALSGAIKVKTEGNDKKPGKYTDELISNNIALAENSDVNKNYTLSSTIEAGDLTVKYNITDDNYDDAFTVKIDDNGTYTYDNKEHGASIESEIEGLKDCLEVWYKEANGEATQETPKHVGEYTVIIKKKADAKCEYVTIPEAGITTDKKITITAIQLTITGSLEVEQGATLDPSYNADKLNLEAETSIEGLKLEFTGSAKPNEKAKTDEAKTIEDAFDAWEEGGSTIQIKENNDYFLEGDITIKEVKIKLIVTEKEVEWYEGEAKAEVTVYVNEEGNITKYGETAVTGNVSVKLADIESVSDWIFVGSQSSSEVTLQGGENIQKAFSFGAVGSGNILMISKKEGEITSIYKELPESIKIQIENSGKEGYLQINFAKDESTEEPENPNEPEWATGDAQGTVTAYVNPEGQITRVEGDGTFSSGRLNIAPEEGWTFAIAEGTDDQPVFSDMFLSKSFTWGVAGNGSLNVYGLDYNESVYWNLPKEVKVQIKNGDKLSYVLIKFEQDDDTWSKDETAAASASVTVYVNTEGKVVSATPKCSIRDGALFIDLEKVDEQLAGWKYSQIVTPEGSVTAKPVMSGDISALFSLMVNNNGDLFVTKETSFDAAELPTTAKVKIENGDKAGYLEIAFEKVIVINPGDITVGGDDVDNDGIIDENGNLFIIEGTGKNTIYDSETHELALIQVAGLDEPLRVVEDYDVVYTDGGTGDLKEDLPYHAGTYTATITLGDKYITTSGAKEIALTVEITKRDLHLAFSIEEKATIEDLNEKLDLADGLVICTPNNLAPNDDLSGVITATFTIGQEPVDGLYPVYPETIHFENTADFDREDYNITYDYTDLEGNEHRENITPDEDGDVEVGDGEGEIPADDPIGGIEYVDPETGEGSAGGYYEKKYRLYLAVKDKNNYYVEDAEADYKAEGLELFSRRDKKTTWAGGSFTVYYKHNDVVNEGGYRVFIKRGKHADYEEVKLDEVSGYYQIRNVQSDIYVRLYFGTGFPVANEEITATDARAYAQANKIVVITPEPTDVQIISMAGAVVATDQVTGQREFANLAEGVYIVRMGETVIKLQVRN